jgi:hypothetical protein
MGCASKEHRRLASQHDPFPLSSGGVVWLGRGLNEAGGWSEPQQCSRVWGRQGGRQVLPLQGYQALECQQGSGPCDAPDARVEMLPIPSPVAPSDDKQSLCHFICLS